MFRPDKWTVEKFSNYLKLDHNGTSISRNSRWHSFSTRRMICTKRMKKKPYRIELIYGIFASGFHCPADADVEQMKISRTITAENFQTFCLVHSGSQFIYPFSGERSYCLSSNCNLQLATHSTPCLDCKFGPQEMQASGPTLLEVFRNVPAGHGAQDPLSLTMKWPEHEEAPALEYVPG
ncbi:hypothetical protein T06_2846 [Trichinella sp. T6]|nr:hypothetical protein T06_2846 [Trichinella sp. T6]